MTATTTIAPHLTADEIKARKKAEKKRKNNLIGKLETGLTNLQHAIWGTQDRVNEARAALKGFGEDVPTQAVLDYLAKLDEVMALGASLAKGYSEPALNTVVEHLFPGRVEKIRQANEESSSDAYTQTMERYAGWSGE